MTSITLEIPDKYKTLINKEQLNKITNYVLEDLLELYQDNITKNKLENDPNDKLLNSKLNSNYILINKNKLSEWIQRLKDSFYNEKKDNYWPFEWEQAISFLNLLDYEDRIQ